MSTSFASALKNTFNNETVLTENGAVMYKTSSNSLVDCNFALSSFRQKSEEDIIRMFSAAFADNREYAIRWLFMARDVHEGNGERRTFRILIKWLAKTDPSAVRKLIPVIAEYGRFDDLFALLDTDVEKDIMSFIDMKITEDYKNMTDGKPVSLLAKWLKSPNTSSPASRAIAKKIYTALNLKEKDYRRMLVKLRAYLNVVETKASAGKWGDIDYEAVPSMANLKYKNAFLKHDEARRREYLGKLEKGEAKINASACFPADIVYRYLDGGYGVTEISTELESMWKALPKIGSEDMNIMTVVDTSGSMTWCTCSPNSAIRPYDVALSLGIYCSENLKGPFKDKCVTFSSSPSYIDMSGCRSLREKLNRIQGGNVGGSTDIRAVMKLILKTAVDNHLKQSDIPALVILSDMEFDQGAAATYGYDADKTALFKEIEQIYTAAGYKLPKIFYWNLASRTNGIPIQNSQSGVGLVSGYSQNTVKMLLSDRLDPWEILKEQLDTERYSRITALING